LKRYNVAVVGATGLVGREVLNVLAERQFPVGKLTPLASEDSVGMIVEFKDEPHVVQRVSDETFEGIDFAIFAAGNRASARYAPVAAKAGATVIDNSSYFRMDPQVPLIIPEINGQQVFEHKGIIANPNCSTVQLVMVLYPLQREFGVRRAVVSTYQSVSGTGKRAFDELAEQSVALLSLKEAKVEVYPYRIGFNLLPQIGQIDEDGYSEEERKLKLETAKILGTDDILISPTCVRVPVFNCHSQAVHFELKSAATPRQVADVLSHFAGVAVIDGYLGVEPTKEEDGSKAPFYPLPSECSDRDEVFVGRIRQDDTVENGISLWSVMDNLRKGAALNAVQIAEMLF